MARWWAKCSVVVFFIFLKVNRLIQPKVLPTYQNVRSSGTPMAAVVNCIHCQSCISHVTSENNVICRDHDGIATDHDLHLACVNSDVILYWTVSWKPMATPMKKRTTVNMSQETEKAETTLNITNDNRAKNNGGFRPTRSAIWPQARFPTNTPAICTDAIVVGTQFNCPHTKDHWNKDL